MLFYIKLYFIVFGGTFIWNLPLILESFLLELLNNCTINLILNLNFILILALLLLHVKTNLNLEFNYILLSKRNNPWEENNQMIKKARLSSDNYNDESNNEESDNADNEIAGITNTEELPIQENNTDNLEGDMETDVNTPQQESLNNASEQVSDVGSDLDLWTDQGSDQGSELISENSYNSLESVELRDPTPAQLAFIQNPIPEPEQLELFQQEDIMTFLNEHFFYINYSGIENLNRELVVANIIILVEAYITMDGEVRDLHLANGLRDTLMNNVLYETYGADIYNVSDDHYFEGGEGSNEGSDSGSNYGSSSSESLPGTPPNLSTVEIIKDLILSFLLELPELFIKYAQHITDIIL